MAKEDKSPAPISPEEAKAALNQEFIERQQKCGQEIQDVLTHYRATLIPYRRETEQGVKWGVDVALRQD